LIRSLSNLPVERGCTKKVRARDVRFPDPVTLPGGGLGGEGREGGLGENVRA